MSEELNPGQQEALSTARAGHSFLLTGNAGKDKCSYSVHSGTTVFFLQTGDRIKLRNV